MRASLAGRIGILLLLFAAPVSATINLVGISEKELLSLKGTPTSQMIGAHRSILQWSDLTVTMEGGVVVRAVFRDAAAEAKDRERRAKLVADLTAKRETEKKLAAEKLQKAKEFMAERSRAHPTKVETDEERRQHLAEFAKRQAENQARAATMLALHAEINTLRMNLQRAYRAGDKVATFNLDAQLEAKKRQLLLMEKQGAK